MLLVRIPDRNYLSTVIWDMTNRVFSAHIGEEVKVQVNMYTLVYGIFNAQVISHTNTDR